MSNTSIPTERKQYRAPRREKCWACETNIQRGMTVVYVANKRVHARCERIAVLSNQWGES